MKKKIKIFLIIVIIILILAGLGYRIFLWKSSVKNLNFYEKDGEIWKVDLNNNKEGKISDGISPALSPDKDRLAYIQKDIEKLMAQIKILNIKTGKETILKKFEGSLPIEFTICGIIWSPDAKYLLVDRGTSLVRGKTVIDSKTGEDIISFAAYSSNCEWLNNKEIVFNEPQGSWNFRPYGAGKGSGISVINLNGQKKMLKQATLNKDYGIVKILNENIYFCARTVKEAIEDN